MRKIFNGFRQLTPQKTIMITGGAGFIGGNLVHAAAELGFQIIVLDALTYSGNLATIKPVIEGGEHVFIEGSIANCGLVADILATHRPHAIFNLAAESHVDRSIDAPRAFIDTNIVGTYELLEATTRYLDGVGEDQRAQFRFIHISTDEVYGSIDDGLFHETSPYDPTSPYAASKACSDHLVRAYHRTYGLPAIITNCSNNFGPYQYPEKLIPLMTISALQDRTLPIYGDGLNVRDWLYVRDHCDALFQVFDRGQPGQTFNVGGNNELSNLEVVHLICDIVDNLHPRDDGTSRRGLIKYVDDRPAHDRRYAIDATKILEEIGWSPKWGFEAGLRSTIKWYIDNPQWWSDLWQQDQGARLGLGRMPEQADA
jgi:dTDP-glucose 4,6-dehydratase